MISCPNCKAENPDGSVFCESCGKPLSGQATGSGLDDLSNLNTISGDETKHRNWRTTEDTALELGTVFADRYTIQSVIGRGGMGIVYHAKDSIGDRDVALKLIRSDVLGGEGAVKRLIAEGVVTQDIRHKNVVAIYNVGQVDDQPFVSMEFVNGVSLREWQRQQVNARTEVPLRVAARIIAEILDGLDAAHSLNIVHRDLKPENIMLTTDPTETAAPLKILDFGIARAAGNKLESNTTTGLGTPRYMAPEQITNPDSAGPPADLYSLSVIFYELLVDVLPQGHWQPPSGGRSDVSPKIDKLIEAGLSNRPASRPQTAKAYRTQMLDAVNNPGGGYAPPQRLIPPVVGGDGGMPAVAISNPFKQAWVKWTAIGCGGLIALLIVLGIIGAIVDTGKKHTDGYPALSGRWVGDAGGSFNVVVATDGSFGGNGTSGDGMSVSINGRFNGVSAQYEMSGGGTSLQGTAQLDAQGCDLVYVSYNPDGSLRDQGKLHINHNPNEPCPRATGAKE